MSKRCSRDEARRLGEAVGVDWATASFGVDQFRDGLNAELQHADPDGRAGEGDDALLTAAETVLAHLAQRADWYVERSAPSHETTTAPKVDPARPATSASAPERQEPPPAQAGDAGVVRWRRDMLMRAGFVIDDAALLASRPDIDVRDAVSLVRRGCPPAVALRILC